MMRDPAEVDRFLAAFFGEGNIVNIGPNTPEAAWLEASLEALRSASDVPVVLPRRKPDRRDRLYAYVIARDRRHAAEVAELLTAFVGPSYSHFDGLPARLDPGDPVDHAVLTLTGGLPIVFCLYGPSKQADGLIWKALRSMQSVVKMRPRRIVTVHKPVGRMLAEFDAALAAGEHSASGALLDQIAADGGLSATNLAHLRIKRLARLGRDAELLRLPGLADVVLTNPPVPVIDDILTAFFTTTLAGPVEAGNLAAVRTALERGSALPLSLDIDVSRFGPEASTVLAGAAWVREDATALKRLLSEGPTRSRIDGIAPALAVELAASLDLGTDTEVEDEKPADTGVTNWASLVTGLAAGAEPARSALSEGLWRDWPPPVTEDHNFADILNELGDEGAERAWSAVGAFLDADGYEHPATMAAGAFISNALTYGRFDPGDLAVVVALTDIVLRGAPTAGEYAGLLDDLRSECSRWVAPERALPVLDLAEQLIRHACPDEEARLRLALELLRPLSQHAGRLEVEQVALAQELARELHLDLPWPAPDESNADDDPLAAATGTILLYSLDEGVLARAQATLARLAPNLKIVVNSDKVGGPSLRQHARGANVVILATRCATHAATGFIQANAGDAVIRYADGSGSASLLRAALSGLGG
jgi:hypothetical protein